MVPSIIRNQPIAIITPQIQVTQVMLYQIASLKTSFVVMIQTVLTNVVTPLKASVDELDARMVVYEWNQRTPIRWQN